MCSDPDEWRASTSTSAPESPKSLRSEVYEFGRLLCRWDESFVDSRSRNRLAHAGKMCGYLLLSRTSLVRNRSN